MCERKLSVCIIVKNEEENLKKCLLALLAFPFEIVVVDTGSADRTVEVAKRYTEQVYDFAWCDDFAAAKNFAIQKASNDLVLVLDSDEYIEPMSEKELNAFLCLTAKNPGKVGRIKRRNFFRSMVSGGRAWNGSTVFFQKVIFIMRGVFTNR